MFVERTRFLQVLRNVVAGVNETCRHRNETPSDSMHKIQQLGCRLSFKSSGFLYMWLSLEYEPSFYRNLHACGYLNAFLNGNTHWIFDNDSRRSSKLRSLSAWTLPEQCLPVTPGSAPFFHATRSSCQWVVPLCSMAKPGVLRSLSVSTFP